MLCLSLTILLLVKISYECVAALTKAGVFIVPLGLCSGTFFMFYKVIGGMTNEEKGCNEEKSIWVWFACICNFMCYAKCKFIGKCRSINDEPKRL